MEMIEFERNMFMYMCIIIYDILNNWRKPFNDSQVNL